jgi:hypothetical protein
MSPHELTLLSALLFVCVALFLYAFPDDDPPNPCH